jgi:hypothetical protein
MFTVRECQELYNATRTIGGLNCICWSIAYNPTTPSPVRFLQWMQHGVDHRIAVANSHHGSTLQQCVD